MEDTITQQWGAFGAVFLLVIGPLAAFATHQTRQLALARQAHIDSATAVTGTVIAVIKDFSDAAREQVRSQVEQRAVSEKVVEALDRVEARIGSLEAAMGRIVSAGERTNPTRPR
jgi:hypothetical protein